MADSRDNLRSQQVDVAVADYLEAIERGTPPDREAFLARHADIAGELREFLDDYQAVNRVMPNRQADTSANGRRSTGGTRKHLEPILPLPCWFAGFELLEEIARGGMGVVYKALQKNPNRIVALKMILAGQLASQADVDRFSVEAHAAAALDHPNIVPIFEVGQHEGQHYFAMGYVAGESLAQRLLAGPLPAREAASIIADVALAVHYSHGRGIVHRDLKPANILVDSDGRVRVTDFGLAKRQTDESGLTCTGQLLGTPSFMSPEQVSGDPAAIGPASDVYSLGATLYALVTGRPPFHAASTVDTLKQVTDRDPVPPRELDATIPRDLETIVLKALSKEPASRYHTADEMADDLRRFLADRPILARRSTTGERFVRWCRRNPVVASLATIATIALVAGTIASTWQAIRATRAENLAEERSETEQAARQAADKARAAEVQQRQIAEANLQRAEEAAQILSRAAHKTDGEEPYLRSIEAAELLVVGFPDRSDYRARLETATDQWVWFRVVKGGPGDDYEALNAFLEASRVQLNEQPNDRTARARVAIACMATGKCGYWKRNDTTRARELIQEALDLFRELAEAFPDQEMFDEHWAQCERSLGELAQKRREFDQARAYFESSVNKFSKLATNPNHPQWDGWNRHMEGSVLIQLAEVLAAGGRTQDVVTTARRAVEIYEALTGEYPKNYEYRSQLDAARFLAERNAERGPKDD